mmetsp:Transcript_13957/g.38065  ORF Transcript_13957/g.38065 Transcript_13957/m.38065 type:complete len:520 (-) Transcript_13957:4331-5890(-)
MRAAVDARRADAARHGGGRRDVHAVHQGQVADDVGRTADGAVRADAGRAGHRRATRHGGIAADVHVMGNLDEVVELDAVLDDGVAQRPTVDAGVGTNLDIVADADRAELLDLDVAVLAGREAEAVRADDHAAVHDAAHADAAALAEHHTGRQPGAGPHPRAALDDAMGADACTVTDDGTGLDDRERADLDALPQRRLGRHDRARMHARVGGRARAGGPPLGQAREVEVGVGRDDGCAACGCHLGQRGRNDDAARPRGAELGLVAWIGEEADAVSVSLVQRRNGGDAQFGPTKQIAAQGGDQLGQHDRCRLTRPERDRSRAHGSGGLFLRVQRVDHLLRDVDTCAEMDGVLQDQVVLLVVEDLLDDLVGLLDHGRQLLVLALGQVFLPLALLALQVAVLFDDVALAAVALRLGQRRRILFELFSGSTQLGLKVAQILLALAELGFQLDLGSLGQIGFAQHALAVDVADLQFLGLHGRGGHHHCSGQRHRLQELAHHQNAVPIWNWNFSILSVGCLRIGLP